MDDSVRLSVLSTVDGRELRRLPGIPRADGVNVSIQTIAISSSASRRLLWLSVYDLDTPPHPASFLMALDASLHTVVYNVSLFNPPLDTQPFQSLQTSSHGELLHGVAITQGRPFLFTFNTSSGQQVGKAVQPAGPFVTLMAVYTNFSTQQEALVFLDPTHPVELYFADLHGIPRGSVRLQVRLPPVGQKPISLSLCAHGDRAWLMDDIDRAYAFSLRSGELLANLSRAMPDDQQPGLSGLPHSMA
ncbi:MAG: hypothetical protein ACREU2_14735, partial [Steroidobacteraceae bacterium]